MTTERVSGLALALLALIVLEECPGRLDSDGPESSATDKQRGERLNFHNSRYYRNPSRTPQFDHPAAHQLVKLLPRLIVVDAFDSPHGDWIASTLRLMAAEARELQPGGETVITRLADILVIHAIRSWIARDPNAQTGWLGALQDKQIGRAIARIHREPARYWSLETLASEAAMSRSAFAARFAELVGEPAMHYVTRWRMHTALMWLQEDAAPVGDLSRRLGYQSEAAFSRAFKRHMGISPGAARRKG